MQLNPQTQTIHMCYFIMLIPGTPEVHPTLRCSELVKKKEYLIRSNRYCTILGLHQTGESLDFHSRAKSFCKEGGKVAFVEYFYIEN